MPQENGTNTPIQLPGFNEQMMEDMWRWVLTSGARIALILVIIIASIIAAGLIIRRIQKLVYRGFQDEESLKRVNTLFGLVRKIVRAVILTIGLLIILSELGIDMGPVLATVGIFGLAVSFGAQSLVKDMISGFFLLAENQMRVGDYVEVGEHSGLVEDLRIRTVVLRDIHGNTHVIPNGKVEEFVNMSKEFARAVIDIGVSYRENIDRVMEILEDEGRKMAEEEPFNELITEPLAVLGVNSLADSAVEIRCSIKTRPGQQWSVRRHFLWRIKNRFDAEGVEIPFPHRTIYWGEPAPGRQQGLEIGLREEAREALERGSKKQSENRIVKAGEDSAGHPESSGES